MELFVEKHLSRSGVVRFFLGWGLRCAGAVAAIAREGKPLLMAAADFVLVDVALFLSAFIYYGTWSTSRSTPTRRSGSSRR